ncbi:hypothetical protein M9H77_29422 [Catharanthus roseus]|uniref:Uncharacterized protein n=1 Tax=Catharanthus roseus TaxID=4058 RepID=A0ACB9ZW78_CATRO|nr:hypothetical protein M9H77_29422 [Catharanthus roseus]
MVRLEPTVTGDCNVPTVCAPYTIGLPNDVEVIASQLGNFTLKMPIRVDNQRNGLFISRAQRKNLKLQEDNNMNAHMEDALRSKNEEFDGQGKPPKLFPMCSISNPPANGRVAPSVAGLKMSADGHMPT